jgi:hypothetical protein
MKVGGEDESKEIFLRPENESARNYYKCDRLVVFVRHDSSELLGFRYGLTLVISTLKIMASTGIFVRIVCALKRSIGSFPCSPSTV